MATDTQAALQPTAGIRFPVASRPQRRFSNAQTVQNLTATSMQPIPLPATGFVRRVSLFIEAKVSGTGLARQTGDQPWNILSGVSLTDATGQSIQQAISGYNLYLVNKYFPGSMKRFSFADPMLGTEYAYSATATEVTARFRLDIDLELDADTGYGCIPNLDANASLQLRIDLAPGSILATGTITSSNVSARIEQWYWAPVGATTGGVANQTTPSGFGDYVETRYENQQATALAENTIPITNRGGLLRGILLISRASGVRTDLVAGSNVGLLYDNNAVDEGITIESHNDWVRRNRGLIGAKNTNAYTGYAAGAFPGLDQGVVFLDFAGMGGERDTWLSTRVGTLLQVKATPGANATQMEIITPIAQVKDAAAFYNRD